MSCFFVVLVFWCFLKKMGECVIIYSMSNENRLPVVALVGQTNAGKSSLLNRLAGRRVAIVAREEGTTRDNVVAKIGWGEGGRGERSGEGWYRERGGEGRDDGGRYGGEGRFEKKEKQGKFILVDTAGLKNPEDEFEAGIQGQIADAVEMADVVLVVMDATKYPDFRDKEIARGALKSRKPVLLLLNKSDSGEALGFEEFQRLGVKEGETLRTSATTGMGMQGLLGRLGKEFRKLGFNEKNTQEKEGDVLKIALIGRPNVGKSSLFNALAQKQQALVSARQGTTRDVNRVRVKYKGRELEILDTAGLRKPGKREVGIEKFSAVRTLAAIEEADVCALLVDATEPHSKLDQALAGEIAESGKGIVMVITKMDLVEDTDEVLDGLERDFDFLPYAPVLLVSNVTGKNVTKLFELALEIEAARQTEVKTSELNRILSEAVASHPPAGLKNTHPKLRYMVQTDNNPPWFVVYGKELGLLHWSYKRYLERKLREVYPYVGVPIFFSFREDS